MKKLISVVLILSMTVLAFPMFSLTATAQTAVATGTWSDAGNYDLSWIAETTLSNNTAEVGGKHYQVQGYAAGTAFTIDSAKELAGLAVLVNAKSWSNAFQNCTFEITADVIDLSAHEWVPIGKTFAHKFSGNITGKGSTSQVVIKNMTVNGGTPDYTDANGTGVGFIGLLLGGSVSNLKFENTVINAVGYRVGTVAAQCNNSTVTNVSADTKIKLTTDNPDKVWDACGGIVGCTYAGATVENCIFTGTIENAGDASGGIVGINQQNITVRDCAVISEHISHGVSSDYNGCGGVIGVTRSGNTATVSGCYVSAYLTSANVPVIGGMIGRVIEDKTVNISDCHFDGIIPSTGSVRGAFIGRLQSANITLTLSNCLNTGIAVYNRTMSEKNAFSWIGLSYMNAKTLTLNISGCYSTSAIPYLAIAESINASYKGTIDGNTIDMSGVNQTDVGKAIFANYQSGTVSFYDVRGDKAATKLTALDFKESGKWQARDGMLPTLKIAAAIADNTYATADLSWFDAADTENEKLIDDYHKLAGLSMLAKACVYGTCTFDVFMDSYKVKVSELLDHRLTSDWLEGGSYAFLTESLGVISSTRDTANVVQLYAQPSTVVSEDGYSIRIVAEINGKDWEQAAFSYIVSYVVDGVEYSSKPATAVVDTCYEAIYVTENGTPVKQDAPEGHYYVAFVLTDIPATNGNTEITVSASLTDGEGQTVSGNTAGAVFDQAGACVETYACRSFPTVLDQGDGCVQRIFEGATQADYTAYLAHLARLGYELYTTNTLEENLFATYVNGESIVNVSYMKELSRMDVIVDARAETALPGKTADESGTLETLFTQVGLWSDLSLDHTKVTTDQNGMSYVMRLSDGSFIVIDGGHGEAEKADYKSDADALYEILKKQASDSENIVIAAWVFTHAHGDHTGTFVEFADDYADAVTVEQFIYNFPNTTIGKAHGDTRSSVMNAINSTAFCDVPRVKAHVGQKFLIRNAEIEILCNLELISPVELAVNDNGYNDTSLVFSLTANDYKIMMLADCYGNEDAMLRTVYTAETLQSDAVQLGHHGVDGIITDDIYELIGAKTVFWPSASYHYAGYVNQSTGIVHPKFLLWGVTSTDMRKNPWNKWTQEAGVTVYLAADDVYVCTLANGTAEATEYETVSAYLAS